MSGGMFFAFYSSMNLKMMIISILLAATINTASAELSCVDVVSNVSINAFASLDDQNIQDIIEVADSTSTSRVSFYGEITKSSIDRLIKKLDRAIRESETTNKEITVVIDSGGGDINHSIRANRYIRNLNRNPNIQVHTKVSSYNSCESACTILYTAGEKRFAGERTKFGFHSPKFVRGHVDGYTNDDLEEHFRNVWLSYVSAIDQTAAAVIKEKRYLYDDDMSYMSGKNLSTGYVTDLL